MTNFDYIAEFMPYMESKLIKILSHIFPKDRKYHKKIRVTEKNPLRSFNGAIFVYYEIHENPLPWSDNTESWRCTRQCSKADIWRVSHYDKGITLEHNCEKPYFYKNIRHQSSPVLLHQINRIASTRKKGLKIILSWSQKKLT